jgi:hypothetical protein
MFEIPEYWDIKYFWKKNCSKTSGGIDDFLLLEPTLVSYREKES